MVQRKKAQWLIINLLGGTAVIGSYLWGFLTRPEAADVLWGGVPAGLRPSYTAWMPLAAAGYLVFSFFLLRAEQVEVQVAGRFGFGIFNLLYLLILIPSALWMPLTLLAVDRASALALWLVRVDLALVALGGLGLLLAFLTLQPRKPESMHLLAVLGVVAFCFQTVILDAIVWVAYFRVG
jgi:hypothetical protein